MDKLKDFVIVFIVGAVIGAFAGGYFFAKEAPNKAPSLGAITVPSVSTTTHGTALQDSLLYQWEYNIVTSLSDVRAPLAGLVSTTTASITFPTIGTSTMNATTTAGGIGALQGDFVLISPATSTQNIQYTASVVTGSATNATFGINAVNGSTTAITPAATTFYIRVLPRASFTVPDSINVSTTTTPYNG